MATLLSFPGKRRDDDYRYVQRKDGGFDFYRGNQKTNIAEYVRATGANRQQLVRQFAQAGDRVSQASLQRPRTQTQPQGMRQPGQQNQPTQGPVTAATLSQNSVVNRTLPSMQDFTANGQQQGVQQKQQDSMLVSQKAKQEQQVRDQLNRRIESDKAKQRAADTIAGLTQPFRGAASGLIKSVAKVPSDIKTGIGTVGQWAAKDGGEMDRRFEKMRQEGIATGRSIDKKVGDFYGHRNDGFVHKVGQAGGGLAADLGTMMLPGVGAGKVASMTGRGANVAAGLQKYGSVIPSVRHGFNEMSQQFEGAKQAGKSDTEAGFIGAGAGLTQAALEKVGLDRFARPAGGNFLTRTLARGGIEGAQEGAQQFGSNAFTKTYNDEQGLMDGVGEAALIGAIAGGGVGLALDSPRILQEAPELARQARESVDPDRIAHNNLVQQDQVYQTMQQQASVTDNTLERTLLENKMAGMRQRFNEQGRAGEWGSDINGDGLPANRLDSATPFQSPDTAALESELLQRQLQQNPTHSKAVTLNQSAPMDNQSTLSDQLLGSPELHAAQEALARELSQPVDTHIQNNRTLASTLPTGRQHTRLDQNSNLLQQPEQAERSTPTLANQRRQEEISTETGQRLASPSASSAESIPVQELEQPLAPQVQQKGRTKPAKDHHQKRTRTESIQPEQSGRELQQPAEDALSYADSVAHPSDSTYATSGDSASQKSETRQTQQQGMAMSIDSPTENGASQNTSRTAKTPNPTQDLSPSSQESPNSQLNQEELTQSSRKQSLRRSPSQTAGTRTRTDRTYSDDTTTVDTEQYVKRMSKQQELAMKSDGSKIKAVKNDFKEKFIDNLAPIEDRLNKAIKNGAVVDPKDHITYQLDRSRRAEGITHAYMNDNGISKIIQSVPNIKEFDQYLIAKHANELDESIATGRDRKSDEALVKKLDAKYAETAKQVYAYNQKLLDTSVEYGLISKATAKQLKKKYPEYVPFNRIFNEDELSTIHGGSGSGEASISKQTAVQKLKGSNRAIASPLNSIIDKTRVVIEQGERNKAAEMLVSYRNLPGNPFNLNPIPEGEPIGSRHTVSYLDKGNKRTFEVDKDIAEAAKNMTRREIGMWGRIAAIPARVLRAGATGVNTGFAGANVVKDVVGSAINSRHGIRAADPRAVGKALAAALHHNGKYYQELMREGVAGTSFDLYRNPNKSNIKEIRSHRNIAARAAYNLRPDQWFRTVEDTIGRSEDFGRALQYYSNKSGFEKKYGKDSDIAKILAADQARNNATNFFRHGSVGQNINLAVPYWNAAVQGARIQTNRIKERPVATVAKIGFAIAAPSVMIALNNYEDEEKRKVMESIPEYEKDGNIIIVTDDAKFNEKTGRWEGVHKIPVPPQHIGIHKTIQNAVASQLAGKEFDILANLGKVVENYTTVNPADMKDTAGKHTPQALKLVAEPLTNTNLYTERKIVPDHQKNLPANEQVGDYTSGTAKVLGNLTGTSPLMVDNVLRTAMGGAGQNAVHGIDWALSKAGVIGEDEIQGTSIAESIKRRFTGAASVSPTEKANKQFDEHKEMLIGSDAYKEASSEDRSRMLNRLESDLRAVENNKAGKSDKELSRRQEKLATEGFKPENYTNLKDSTSTGVKLHEKLQGDNRKTLESYNEMDDDERDKHFRSHNDAEYKYQLAKYENDKLNGKLSEAEDIKTKKSLRKAKVGADYSKDVREMYGLSKAELADYLAHEEEGKDKVKLAEEILKYDRALYDSGASSKLKFKYGFGYGSSGKGGSGKGGSGKRGGGRGGKAATGIAEAKANVSLTSQLNKIRVPTAGNSGGQSLGSIRPPQMQKTPLKKYTVKENKAQKKPIKISTSKARA